MNEFEQTPATRFSIAFSRWNWLMKTSRMFSKYFSSSWILRISKNNLLKYLTLTLRLTPTLHDHSLNRDWQSAQLMFALSTTQTPSSHSIYVFLVACLTWYLWHIKVRWRFILTQVWVWCRLLAKVVACAKPHAVRMIEVEHVCQCKMIILCCCEFSARAHVLQSQQCQCLNVLCIVFELR